MPFLPCKVKSSSPWGVMILALAGPVLAAGGDLSPNQVAQLLTSPSKSLSAFDFTVKRGVRCYKGDAPVTIRCAAEFNDTRHAGQIVYLQFYLFEQPGGFSYTRSRAERSTSSSSRQYSDVAPISLTAKSSGQATDYQAACYQGLGPRSWAFYAVEAAGNVVVAGQVPPSQQDKPGQWKMKLDRNPDCDRAKDLAMIGFLAFKEASAGH